jgi:hypothetical protein
MSHAAWTCTYCDTNNSDGDRQCRVCLAEREKSGVVPTPTTTIRRIPGAGERPVFVESKHAPPGEAKPPSRVRVGRGGSHTPPRTRPRTAPPAPASPPPVPYRRTGSGGRVGGRLVRLLLVVVGVGLVVGNWDSIIAWLPDGSASPAAPTATASPCPPAAAKWLPGGGAGAELEVAYTTPRHVITLCWSADGKLFYDGQLKGQPPSSNTHISIPAVETPAGYSARNASYRYEINGEVVIVTNEDAVLSRQPLTRTGP